MFKTFTFQPLSVDAYQALIEQATILEQDSHGAKVFLLKDNTFLKLFRRKRWFSSEALFPYAERFAKNAQCLKQLGVCSPTILALYNIEKPLRTAVHYAPLQGNTLRHVLAEADEITQEKLVGQFASLLAYLHEQGVYFRSIHLANVLVMPDGELGLIDFADLTKQQHRLSQGKRTRNLKHMQRYPEDAHWLFGCYFDIFKSHYQRIAGVKNSLFLTHYKQAKQLG